MKQVRAHLSIGARVALCVQVALFTSAVSAADVTAKVDFAKDIRPILEKNCYECHGSEKEKSGLRLDLKGPALKGGDNGALLVPGQSAQSLLIKLVEGTRDDIARMPHKREPLPAAQIALLRAWIDQGADWPDSASASQNAKLNHWAFKAPVRPELPAGKKKSWARNPIDQFAL